MLRGSSAKHDEYKEYHGQVAAYESAVKPCCVPFVRCLSEACWSSSTHLPMYLPTRPEKPLRERGAAGARKQRTREITNLGSDGGMQTLCVIANSATGDRGRAPRAASAALRSPGSASGVWVTLLSGRSSHECRDREAVRRDRGAEPRPVVIGKIFSHMQCISPRNPTQGSHVYALRLSHR